MTKKRIAIAGFQHETNTFCPFPTVLSDFKQTDSWPGLTKGNDVIEVFTPLNIPIGGFIKANTDWQLIPVFMGFCRTSGNRTETGI